MILVLIVGLGSSCSDKGTGEETGDETPPTVQSVLPANSSTNVEPTTTIQVTFSEPVDTDDLNTTIFSIQPTVTVSFSRVGNLVTMTPTVDLEWETTYSITISTALSDTAGNDLAEAYPWSFTTMANPNAAPPEVMAGTQWPAPGAVNVDTNVVISAKFTKPMDPASLTTSTFSVAGVSGTISYISRVASFVPDNNLDFNTTYNVAITTAVKDTFDIFMATRVDWSFTTRTNPNVPIVSWLTPEDSTIIDDTITVYAQVDHPIGVDSTRFFVNGLHIETNTSGAFFLFDATLFPIGIGHRLHAVSYADTLVGYSDTLIIFHQWELLDEDLDPIGGIPQDLERAYYRSTDSILEFRFEFSARWNDPVNDSVNQLDLSLFFDTDQNDATGRTTAGGHTLNDIGAEKRAIIGIHGNIALASWNQDSTVWDSLGGPDLFSGLILPWDTTMFEVGFRWIDIDNPFYINMLCLNAYFVDAESVVYDWSPNEGAGHHTIKRANRYVGAGVITPPAPKLRTGGVPVVLPNPFN